MSRQPIADARERSDALDATRSCIVQAPAGSGKTGLLIQRFLRLLACVERPEEILAITFTRKASAEMRRRVLQALERAALDAPVMDDNERLTRELARAALARDQQRGWQLRDNAARLRIQTIDSLCASLARQMPVLSGIGAAPAIVDDARELYRDAAERTLATLETEDAESAPMRRLLRHLDGDWAAASGLLEVMLARRDQWIRRVGFDADPVARAALEDAFQVERAQMMRRLHGLIPAAEAEDIVRLARYAAGNASLENPTSPLANLGELLSLPAHDESGANAWCALSALLLVAEEAKFRQKVDKRHGFPAGKGDATVFKAQMTDLLERLCSVGGLCEALHAVRGMPPARFTDEQWAVLGAMVRVLPLAAAQLQLVFAERGQIDFPGLAHAAVTALGDAEHPTDLLLALDVRLQHLLVDEFQDTSLSQWELLTRLTAGWTPGDGRTVFLVGDPMQSIYRFREADVAVFLRARQDGLPEVALTGLRLSTNFRSRAGIVEWVNAAFAQVLAPAEDAEAGAVPYSQSMAHHPREDAPAVQWHAFVGADAARARREEADRVAAIAAAALTEPEGTVAVLVRNRSHLGEIVPALKRAGVRYRAVDIEPLGGRPVVQDLLALTRALSHPADRIAWLALLRAPWCALGLSEMHALAGGLLAAEGARATVWELLHDESRLALLPPAALARCVRTREALRPFVEGALRGGLRERIERAWLALGGPATLERATDLDDVETFYDQLDALAEAGDIADASVLEEKLAELHAAPDVAAERCVQLMTIHKAKGLEFGTVIVPGLDRMPRASDKPLFAWKARADGRLMVAPVRAAGESKEPAYDYLRSLDDAASDHELERLFYVAATRAVRRLHLLGFARLGDDGLRRPSSRSLLGKAWVIARDAFEAATPLMAKAGAETAPRPMNTLRCLDDAVYDVTVAPIDARLAPVPGDDPIRIEFSWAGETARHVGTITHRWLQRIGLDGLTAWPASRVDTLAPAVVAELARRGVPPAELDDAKGRVLRALRETLDDSRGRWILQSHAESRFEYRLRVVRPEGVRLVVIDRVLTDANGERWIIDYKTSPHEGGDPEAFLDREVERYRAQLLGYAAALGGKPARLGLYFPLLRAWREVEHVAARALIP